MVFKKILLLNEEPEFHGIIWAKPEKDSIDLKIWRGTSWWTVAASSFTPEQISQIIEAVSAQISPEDLGTLSRDLIYNLLSSKANTSDIPTSLSDLNDDATHRTVTDAEKQTWNNKQEPISDLSTIRQNASNAYQKPNTGIPLSDLSEEVQDAIENAGSLTEESDPIFTASPAHGITSNDITNWNGKYTKSNSGIPKTDLANDVQTSLGLADTALQPYTNFDPQTDTVWNKTQELSSAQKQQARNNIGAVGSVTVNGTTYTPTNGNVDLGTISGGGGGDENVIESITFNGTAATIDSSTKNAAISYTPPVTSVNNQTGAVSLTLGDVNTIETVKVNGTALTPDANKAVDVNTHDAVVNHGTSDTTLSLTPNVLHIWGEVTALTLTLATPTDSTIVNEYMFQFTSGSTATTLSLPSTVAWDNEKGEISIESGYIYQVSILNNIALWARVAV